MSAVFMNELHNELNYTNTENGALVKKTTNNPIVDYFAVAGSANEVINNKLLDLFCDAFEENALIALRLAFYFRDVRQGQGRRRDFRSILNYLGTEKPHIAKKIIPLVPFYGRWDDLYAFVGTKVENDVFEYMKETIEKDMVSMDKGKSVSLCAKWLKSENTTSQNSRYLAKKTRKAFGWTPKQYRKTLSALRKYIDIVERKISKNQWNEVDYSKVPSMAFLKYRGAFIRHDMERYYNFIEQVKNGESKMAMNVAYLHQIVQGIIYGKINKDEAQVFWDNIVKNINCDEEALVVVDVSGSMFTPIDGGAEAISASIAMGLFIAYNNKGEFKNQIITFSERPELVKVKGNSVYDDVKKIQQSDWGYNTNLNAVFNVILQTAIKNNLSDEDIPQKVFVITDMEFDEGVSSKFLYDEIKEKFENAGYKMPRLIYWNVNARNVHYPTDDMSNVVLISGFSPNLFNYLANGKIVTIYDVIDDIVNSERYSQILI